jgi:pyruvate,orthophosphate dikinase
MGKPCLSKVPALSIQRDGAPELLVDGQRSNLTSETLVTLDATNGTLLLGRAEFVPSGSNTHLDCLMEYADRFREMRVDAIVNSVEDADHAIKVGPDGVLLSTDYLLSELNARASLLTRYLLTEDEATRSSLLMLIEDNHREQLITLMRRFHRIRISVRLLDLPLSTFLPMPSDDQAMNKLAEEMNLSVHWLRMRILALRDTNPQAGLRGARVFALFPSLLNVQVRAIIGAAKALLSNESLEVRPTIVVPTVATSQEVATIVRKIHSFAQLFLDGAPGGGPAKRKFDDQQRVQQMQAEEAKNGDVSVEMETPAEAPGVYSVGTMLTTPRSLIRSDASPLFFSVPSL